MGILTQFTPNITYKEALLSAAYLCPLTWPFLKEGSSLKKLKSSLEEEFNSQLSFFDSGRSALYAILGNLEKDPARNEVLVSSYTCVVVINAIKKAGYNPVYVDTLANTFQLDPEDLNDKFTSKTKALIVQHTFGNPDHLSEILEQCQERKVFLIEDLAHGITASYQGQKLGTFGDAAFLSFGSGKVISASRGGATLTNDPQLAQKIQSYQNSLDHQSLRQILKHHYKHVIFTLAKPIYFTANIGKAILYLSRKLGLLPDVIKPSEKAGEADSMQAHKFPNSLATVVLAQWKRKEELRQHRLKNCDLYDHEFLNQDNLITVSHCEESACMTYPILAKDSDDLFTYLKENKVILDGTWSKATIVPKDIDQSCTGYTLGSCRCSEAKVDNQLNLPTDIHIKPKHIKKIATLIRNFYEFKR